MHSTTLTLVLLLHARILRAKHGSHSGTVEIETASVSFAQPSPSVTSIPGSPLTSAPSVTSAQATTAPTPVATTPPFPFQWVNPSNATTCQNTTFAWQFNGSQSFPISIVVTNERVAQQRPGVPAPLQPSNGALFTRTITTTVSSTLKTQVWPTVDVPQGWYVGIAFATNRPDDMVSTSQPFFVKNGTDISCLPSTFAITASPTPQSTPSSTPSSSQIPSSRRPGPRMTTPQLIGAIVGVVVGVALIAIVFNVPRIWRRFLPPPPPKRPGAPMLQVDDPILAPAIVQKRVEIQDYVCTDQ